MMLAPRTKENCSMLEASTRSCGWPVFAAYVLHSRLPGLLSSVRLQANQGLNGSIIVPDGHSRSILKFAY
jgi:hypothetical protein